jgi:hypothetical protein
MVEGGHNYSKFTALKHIVEPPTHHPVDFTWKLLEAPCLASRFVHHP